MKAPNITPGPWSTSPFSGQFNPPFGKHWPRQLVHVGEGQRQGNCIANVGLGGSGAISMNQEDIEANARAIAALPECLKALERLRAATWNLEVPPLTPESQELCNAQADATAALLAAGYTV